MDAVPVKTSSGAGAALLAALVVLGCSDNDEAAPPDEGGTPETVGAVQEGPTVVRGFLVLGPEVRSIKPCGEEQELWVIPLTEVTEAYDALSREPYAPVFVEVEGERGPAPETGFGAEYDGQLTVTGFRRAAPGEEGFGCREDFSRFAFRASGVEPFWALQVREDAIVYSTPEIPETLFEAAEAAFAGGAWVYTSVSTGPEPIEMSARFAPGRCSDSMVGAIYSWTATVEIGGEVRDERSDGGRHEWR